MTRNTVQLECFWKIFAAKRHFKNRRFLNYKEIFFKALTEDSCYRSLKHIEITSNIVQRECFWKIVFSKTLFWNVAAILILREILNASPSKLLY